MNTEFIETASGNRISKRANIIAPETILISGNSTINENVTLRGDPSLKISLQIGKFVYIGPQTEIKPIKKSCKIGSFTMIDQNCFIQSSNIGNRVIIGSNCKLGVDSIVHDCCIIKPNTIIPNNLNIPPFSLISSTASASSSSLNHKLTIETLPESYKKQIETSSKVSYINNQFIPSEIP